jgi:hypothetical protein
MSQYKAIVAAILVLCLGLVTAHTTEEPPAHQVGFGTAYNDENPMPPLSLIKEQHIGEKKKYKKTNHDLQNIYIKLKYRLSNTNPTKNVLRVCVFILFGFHYFYITWIIIASGHRKNLMLHPICHMRTQDVNYNKSVCSCYSVLFIFHTECYYL